MKKLLGILGTITIAGSGMTGIVGNAPTQTKNAINSLQTNNLEILKRSKRQDYKNAINWTINNGIIKSIIVGNNYLSIKNNIVVLNDIFYIFVQGTTENKNKIYK